MNGWQRLYVFALILISSATFGIWRFQKPSDSFYAVGCDYPMYATEGDAKNHLGRHDYREHDFAQEPRCYESLREIAIGEAAAAAEQRWREAFRIGALTLAILFAFIYAIGFGIGWVWRGFFPKKSAASP
ncbi:hypothetical protein [Lysobacter sp. P5_B9]